MPYNPNVPQAIQRISATQQPILGNFTELNTDFNTNHINYTYVNAADRGKHNLVQFVTQIPLAVPPVGVTEIGLYNKVPEAPFPQTGLHELFCKIPGHGVAGVVMDVPFTALNRNTNGWCYLPNGLIIKWGSGWSGTPMAPVLYPDDLGVTIPIFANAIQAFITPIRNSALPGGADIYGYIDNYNANGITVQGYTFTTHVPRSIFFNYLIIGY